MSSKTIPILLIMGLLLSSCNYKSDNKTDHSISSSLTPVVSTKEVIQENEAFPTSAAVRSKQPLPLSVNLDFKPVQMEQLMEGKPDRNWELLKTIPLER